MILPAEVWVPKAEGQRVKGPRRANFLRDEGGYAIYAVGAGSFVFTSHASSDVNAAKRGVTVAERGA